MHLTYRHRPSNHLRQLRQTHPAKIHIITQGLQDWEVVRHPHTCPTNLTRPTWMRAARQSHRVSPGTPMRAHARLALALMTTEKKGDGAPTRTVVDTSRTSRHICWRISPKDRRSAPSLSANIIRKVSRANTTRTVTPWLTTRERWYATSVRGPGPLRRKASIARMSSSDILLRYTV